jgi:hypothetical protein
LILDGANLLSDRAWTKSKAQQRVKPSPLERSCAMQKYSDFFQTLHDEQGPTGHLGRGTHYSVLRAVVFHDPTGEPLPRGHFADFAIIWDEDHDVRVMEPIEEIYRRSLLSSFLMFGESKGVFTAVHQNLRTARRLFLGIELKAICQSLKDPWSFAARSRKDWSTIISDDEARVDLYLRNLEMLWQLGIEDWPSFDLALLTEIADLPLLPSTHKGLKNDNIIYVGDVVQKSEGEMLRTPNFGRKALNDIKQALEQMGLHLGTEVPGWPPNNIRDIAKFFEDTAGGSNAESLDQAEGHEVEERQEATPREIRRV